MSRLAVAALVLLITVGGLFGAVRWNRGGGVQAIVLSERELALPWDWPSTGAAVRLQLQWQRRDEPRDARLWLTEGKLEDLGFVTDVPAGAPEAEFFYSRTLPRRAWVAFELNGPAWRMIEQRRELASPDPANPARQFEGPFESSRLVPVDAAPVRESLVRRYANAPVIVLPAVVRMRFRNLPKEGPLVWAEVESLVAPDVTVPIRLRGHLPEAQAAEGPARYEVDVRVGRLGVLWIEDLRAIGR